MSDAVVSFAVERLGDLLISEAKLLYGVRDQVIEIQRELERMQCFLKEADKRQVEDERVRKWVSDMRCLAFKIEDVIELFALQVASKEHILGFKKMLRRFVCIMCEGVGRHNIAMEINAINAEIDKLTARLTTYGIVTKGLEEGETSSSQVDLKSKRIFYSHNVEKDFVGMEKEMKQLISHLKKKDNVCELVSICGMGGQGKTTLAQKLYNHPDVKAHFNAFAWVCTSQQFDREKVLKEVLEQLFPEDRKKEISGMSDAKLVGELYHIQQQQDCLVVIDDMWTVDSWERLKSAFPVGETSSSSKILFTTRSETLAQIGSIYKISFLTEEEGWQLLCKKARISDISEKKEKSEMETIGKDMVRKCKGLPLAISSLGGILKGKSLIDWKKISKDISFYLTRGEGVTNDNEYYSVMQILGLSYDNLPSRLRHCFLCFANYKEDETIDAKDLYVLWIGEGLISTEHQADGEMMLDVAERYLDELAHRSLVQVEITPVGESRMLKYATCVVHDLIRELCLSKAKEENVVHLMHLHPRAENEFKGSIARRLCVDFNDEWDESMLINYVDQHVLSHIRSFLVSNDFHKEAMWPDKILSHEKFRLLRVFKVSNIKFTVRSIKWISELTYLKYLCLFHCTLEMLPSSIGNLRNLETLDLSVCNAIKVPNVLWKLKQLKHLYLPYEIELTGRAEKLEFKGLNKLELLVTFDTACCETNDLIQLSKLAVFAVKTKVEENLIEKIIEYMESRNMRFSKLYISGDGGSLSCFKLLLECGFINELEIWVPISLFPNKYDHVSFSVHLTQLVLVNCRMEEDPMIYLEKLPGLCLLYMLSDSYLGTDMVISSTGFPQLRDLYLSGLPGLRNWRVDEGAMPNLHSLWVSGCKELEMVPDGLTYLNALEDFSVWDMPKTFTDRMKVTNGIEGEDYYKIKHIQKVVVVMN